MRPGLIAGLALVCLLIGCAARAPRPPGAPANPVAPNFIDLQPGWRLRVVTPILKSGGYVLKLGSQSAGGSDLTLKAGDDFLGYEVAYYAVKSHGVDFVAAETIRNGQAAPQTQPVARLFQLPHGMRHVRLIYLVRVSHADHDMAVAAAKDMAGLNALTERVEADPAGGCQSAQNAYCAWIPAGIAVVPQLQRKKDGADEWAPAR